jgi:hypothetical protein
MRQDLFSIPVFIDQVELDKIKITESPFESTWHSNTPSSYLHQPDIHPDTFDYLSSIIDRHLRSTGKYINPTISAIWRNSYSVTDTQEVHIHAKYQWSFIIYETVAESKTVFLNPAWKSIEAQLGPYATSFPMSWKPEVKAGTIVIFPSFLEHFVLAGNIGTTIAGNISLEYINS